MVVDNVVDKDVANKLHKALRRWSRTFVKILSTSSDDDGQRGDHEIEGSHGAGHGG